VKKILAYITSSLIIISLFLSIFEYWPFKTNDMKVEVYATHFRLPRSFIKLDLAILDGDPTKLPKYFPSFSERHITLKSFFAEIGKARSLVMIIIKNTGNKPLVNINMILESTIYFEILEVENTEEGYAIPHRDVYPTMEPVFNPILNGEVIIKSLPQNSIRVVYVWTKHLYNLYPDLLKDRLSVSHLDGVSDYEFYTAVPFLFYKIVKIIFEFYKLKWYVLFLFSGILFIYLYRLRLRSVSK